MDPNTDLVVKVLLVGDRLVGKSSFQLLWTEDTFAPPSVIGIEFKVKNIQFHGLDIAVHLWDQTGSAKYRGLTWADYRNTSVVLLCIDVTNSASYTNASNWMTNIKDYVPSAPIVIVATKCDDDARRVVNAGHLKKFLERC